MTDRFKWFNPDFFLADLKNNLLDMMRGASLPPAKRADTAAIFLEGQGIYWPNDPDIEAEARAIVAHRGKKAPAPNPMQPKIRARTKNKYDSKRDLAIARECAVLEYAMKHGSNEEKLDAIHAWFVAMEYLAPEKLRKPLSRSMEN